MGPDNPYLIRTFTGRLVDPFHLTPDDIDICDITVALANTNRFAGHTARPMPVSVHCVEVAEMLEDSGYDQRTCLTGLLHDASEAYLLDMPTPIKRRPEMSEYRLAEERAQTAICRRYDLIWPFPEAVHLADAAAYKRDRERRYAHTPAYVPSRGDFLTSFYRLGGRP
jgi:hypothetical protein